MAFNISYIFTARDRYTAVAKKIVIANERINRSADAAKRKSDQLKKSLRGIAATARSMRNIGIGLTAAITLPLLFAARSATKAASTAEETRSKFATIFRDMSSESEMLADNFAKNFGLAGTTARMLLADTADILTGFGFTQKGALDLSQQVNELAADLASFTNFAGGAKGASAALTKALLGERESLKSLGIAITEDLVKKKISLLISQGQKFSSLAEAKALATLAIAVDQSGNAIGDYARTQQSAANVSKRLAERSIELKETFGRILLPITVKIENSLIKFIDTLNALSPGMQRVILIVGGVLAVLGPLLLIIGAIGLALPVIITGFAAMGTAIALMTGPIGIIILLTAAIITFLLKTKFVSNAIGGMIFRIVSVFKSMGSVIGSVFTKLFEFITPLLGVFEKIRGFVSALGIGDVNNINQTNITAASPAVSTVNSQATINGQINVSASPGSQIDSVESNNIFSGATGNVGLGVTG